MSKSVPTYIDNATLDNMPEAELWRHYMIFTQWLRTNAEKTIGGASNRDLNYLKYGNRVKAILRDLVRDYDTYIKI